MLNHHCSRVIVQSMGAILKSRVAQNVKFICIFQPNQQSSSNLSGMRTTPITEQLNH